MDEFIRVIDEYDVLFYIVGRFNGPSRWEWASTGSSEVLCNEVFKTLELLNHDPPIPAVQMWLSSGQYGGMMLEEFLEAARWGRV